MGNRTTEGAGRRKLGPTRLGPTRLGPAKLGPSRLGPAGLSLAALMVLGAAACAGNPSPASAPPSPGPSAERAALQPSPGLRPGDTPGLRPGDAVRVRIWREGDLSGTFPVAESGVVVLPLLGERRATGLEPVELEGRLVAEYAGFLENPAIEVTALRRIAVLGEVRSPGLYRVDATVSLAEALAQAGGVTNRGRVEDVRLFRDGRMLRPLVRDGVVAEPVPLASGDRIVVERRSWIARNAPLFGLGVGGLAAAIAAIAVAGS